MTRHLRRFGPNAWVISLAVVWFAAIGVTSAEMPAGKELRSAAEKPAVALDPSQAGAVNVGDDACATCHAPQKASVAESRHGRAADARTPAAKQGCETCHGPGSRHVADPMASAMIKFKKLSADEVNATCRTCHARAEHALWEGSPHEARDLSCTSCHSVHSAKSAEKQLIAKDQMTLCASCHRDKVSKVDRSGHMPVREGKMQCTSCHNVHGSTSTKLLRVGNSVSELCTSCHAEKRGPYLWEHAPVRDGCTTCHDPHGSSNERMLVSKPPLLCQRCHIGTRHPSSIYDGAQVKTSVRVFARSCVTCHSAVHGSNHPSGQRFVR